jgi:PAS domain S-box-containing protein
MSTSATLAMIAAALITAILIAVVIWRSRPGPARREGVRILAESVVDMVSTHDADGAFRYISPLFAGLLGEYPGMLVGKHPNDFAHADDVPALAALFRRGLEWSGTPTTAIWRCRRHDGQYAWLETTARATTGELKELGAVVCASRDITERKQIEDALRDSENRFRTAVESVRLVAVGLDTAGRVTFANDALCALMGWTRSELIGESWFDRFVPAGDAARATFFDRIGTGDVPPKLENEIICRDGKRRRIEWDNTMLRSLAGQVLGTASLGVDVTERRHEETTLKLLQSITLAISAAKDLNGALELTLESLCDATGWGYGEAWLPASDGARVERTTFYSGVGVDASPLIESGADRAFAPDDGLPGRAWQSKSVVWVPDISEFASPTLGARAVASGLRAAVAVPVLAGQDVVAILVFFMDRPRATDVRHTQMVFVVANQVSAVIGRRRTEKLYASEILRARDQAQAASHAKSDFLSRMSHELRTPLNSVIGFANVMRKNKSARLSEEDLTFLDRIKANGQHLLTLVNNVLDIAKVESGRLTVTTGLVAVGQLLHDVAAQLEGQPRAAGVQLRVDTPEDVTPIQSDGVLLRQVVINLAGNALRFTHEGSVVLGADIDVETGVPLRIHVRDTGIGIARDRQQAIFEPFEQADVETHRSYGGTGLGLSISKAICDALGYLLTVDSEVGKGSTFTVHLGTGKRDVHEGVSDSDRTVPNTDSATLPSSSSQRLETKKR